MAVQNKPTFKKKGSSWKKKGKAKVANSKPNPTPKAKPRPLQTRSAFIVTSQVLVFLNSHRGIRKRTEIPL